MPCAGRRRLANDRQICRSCVRDRFLPALVRRNERSAVGHPPEWGRARSHLSAVAGVRRLAFDVPSPGPSGGTYPQVPHRPETQAGNRVSPSSRRAASALDRVRVRQSVTSIHIGAHPENNARQTTQTEWCQPCLLSDLHPATGDLRPPPRNASPKTFCGSARRKPAALRPTRCCGAPPPLAAA